MKKRRHDAAPNEEWVLMYRRGLTANRIGRLIGRPENTVLYHLRLAKAADSSLHAEHIAAHPKSRAHNAMVESIVRYVQEQERLPTSKALDPEARRVGYWIERRRFEANNGILSEEIQAKLDEAMPKWREPQKKQAEDAKWLRKFDSLVAYLSSGNDWPRNRTGESEEERAHGRWIGTQRHLHGKDQLLPNRRQILDEVLPGWVRGRKGNGGRPASG